MQRPESPLAQNSEQGGLFDHRFEEGRVLVIVPDRLSALIAKGEVSDRYYNPGELFREVHLAVTNDDDPPLRHVQRMVGAAKLMVHRLPTPRRFLLRTLGWRTGQLRAWLDAAVAVARMIKPELIRCYGADVNLLAARHIKRTLKVPYVVSLHTNLEQRNGRTYSERLRVIATDSLVSAALREADLVLPVYRGILPYLEARSVPNVRVAYNALNAQFLERKKSYRLHCPPRVLCVSRQIAGKNPVHLIRAVAKLKDVRLTLVGDGPLHARLKREAECAADRIEFYQAWTNEEVSRRLPEFDVFAGQNHYWGIPKAYMECLLAGMPLLTNRLASEYVPELDDSMCMMVEDSTAGYLEGLGALLGDKALRSRLGRAGRARACTLWLPQEAERHYVEMYRSVLASISV